MKKYFLTLFLLIFMSLVTIPNSHAKLYALKDRALKDFTIPELSEENLDILLKDIIELKSLIVKKLQLKGKSPKKIQDDSFVTACDFIQEELQWVYQRIQNNDFSVLTIRKYIRTMRVWYSVEADFREDSVDSTRIEKLIGKMVIMGRLNASPLVIRLKKRDPDDKIGRSHAEDESSFLVNSEGTRISREELAKMTHREASLLNPPENNVLDLSDKIPPENRYDAFVSKIEKMVQNFQPEYSRFSFEESKKVLFFDKIKKTASSPKADIFDKFGIDWKLKWGDEVHTEPFMIRLYMALGGRYADIKYFLPRKSVPFILHRKEDKKEVYFQYLYELEDAMLDSVFQFHLNRYVVEEGLLYDEQNRPLGHGIVDENFVNEYQIDPKYMGTYYVYFKEALISFASPVVKRLGPAAFSEHGAESSRIARGSLIFNCFFKNKDCKDDNNRIVLVYNYKTGKFDIPIEYQHDLGYSISGLRTAGDINKYEWDFIQKLPGFYGFRMKTRYYPYAWNKASFADAMWMARKIVSLEDKVYWKALRESGWPDFAQKLLFLKIQSRRNDLIEKFHLEQEGFQKKQVNPKITLEMKDKNGLIDYPVKDGKISPPEKSLIVTEQIQKYHPEGLGKIISRGND